MVKRKIRIFEVYAGLGSYYQALKEVRKGTPKEASFDIEDTGAVECYLPAIKVINALKGDRSDPVKTRERVGSWHFPNWAEAAFLGVDKANYLDVHKVPKLPTNLDILCYSPPSTDFYRKVKIDTFSQISRLLGRAFADGDLPKVLVLDTCTALVPLKNRDILDGWIEYLSGLGYTSDWQVLNATDYGSCQNRNTFFLVSWLDHTKVMLWPKKEARKQTLRELLSTTPEEDKEYQPEVKPLPGLRRDPNGVFVGELDIPTKTLRERKYYVLDEFGPHIAPEGVNSNLRFLDVGGIRYLDRREKLLYQGWNNDQILKILSVDLGKIAFNKLVGAATNLHCLKKVLKKVLQLV